MTIRKWLFVIALACTLVLPSVQAPAAPESGQYVLASDDVIKVDVANFPNLTCQAVVLPDGSVTVPLLGSVAVRGKTTTEVAALLAKQWNEQVVDPLVTVSLTQRRKASILVYGFAVKGGEVDYRPGLRITEVLAQTGGAALNGDLSKLTLTHRSGDKQVLDMVKPESLSGTERDILMQEGDIIYIPERRTQVSVLGEVMKPGPFDFREDITALDVISAAGGVKETADLNAATIEQGGKEKKLDLEALLRKGDMTANVKLTPADRIMIPELQNRTYVFGSVGRPGWYPLKPGDRILDALNASGISPQADYRKVRLIKVDKTNQTAKVEEINLEKFLKKGDFTANATLAAGDVVFISDKKRGFKFADVFSVLSGIGMIDNTFRILSGNRGGY